MEAGLLRHGGLGKIVWTAGGGPPPRPAKNKSAPTGSGRFLLGDLRELLVHHAHVVCAGCKREARTCHLRQPPHLSNPATLVYHHFFAQILHKRRAYLPDRINCGRTSKPPQKRVGFLAVSA